MMLLQKYGASKPILVPAKASQTISNTRTLDANIPKLSSAKGSSKNIIGNKSVDNVTEG